MGFALVIFGALRLVYWLGAFPNADEAYYWWWGRNFSLSYYDHPPLFAWLQGVVTLVLPHGFWSLRLLNLITNGICFYIYWWLVGYLYPRERGRAWLVVLTAVFGAPLYFVMLTLAWHDHLLVTLCLASSVFFVRYLDNYKFANVQRDHLLYVAVLLFAFALITKCNAIFFGLGCVVAVWGDRQLRLLITWRRVLIVLGICGVVFLPVLLWNVQYDFPSFRYYLMRSVEGGSWWMRLVEPVGFVLFSLLMLSPFNGWLIYRGWQCCGELAPRTVFPQVAIAVFVVSTGILLGVSLISTAYYYWNITAYLLLFPLIPLAWQRYAVGKVIKGAIVYGVVFALLFVINYTVLPIAALVSADADPDGRMLYGWEEVAQHIGDISQDAWLVTTDYRSAGAIAYAMPDRRVTALSQRISQFDFVQGDQPLSRFVLVWDDWYPLTPWHTSQIARINLERVVPIYRWGVWLKNYYIATAQGLHPIPKLRQSHGKD